MPDAPEEWLMERVRLLGEVFQLRLKLSNIEEERDDARSLARAYLELLPGDVQEEEMRLRHWLDEP